MAPRWSTPGPWRESWGEAWALRQTLEEAGGAD
jgi:hypothetical protein